MKIVPPFTVLIGILFSALIASGVAFSSMLYSVRPIFAVPEGRITFCALTAFTTSLGVSPRDSRRLESISTIT